MVKQTNYKNTTKSELQLRSISYTTWYYRCGWLLAELDDFNKKK